jgi:hypothetical protein
MDLTLDGTATRVTEQAMLERVASEAAATCRRASRLPCSQPSDVHQDEAWADCGDVGVV